MAQRSIFTKLRDKTLMTAVDTRNASRFASLNRQTGMACGPDEHPVLFFNASTRLTRTSLNAAFAWLTANGLRQDGIPAHFLVCQQGLSPCLLRVDREGDFCKGCMTLSDQIYDGIPVTPLRYEEDKFVLNEVEGLDESLLAEYVYEGVPLGELTIPSLRWILRRHHLDDIPEAAPLHRKFICSAWSTFLQAKEAVEELQPRAIVVFNGLQYPEAVVKWLGKQLGIPTFTHEIGLMPFTAIFTEGEATACPIDLPDDFVMTPERDAKLDAYLSKRMKGNFTTAGITFWSDMQPIPTEFWERARKFRQIVPVFTNVVFDTSQKHANTVYSDMFAWLDDVKKLIHENADTLFVIRAHPDEIRPGKESRETVTDWYKNSRLSYCENVMYVGPEEYLSSYELIQHAKFVMVYNSTIGLEASIMGAPVLCAGRSRYSQVPLCWFPQTVEEQMAKARELLACAEVDLPKSFQETARRFMYYQFFHTALSFGDFIEPDGVWNGYVSVRKFAPETLSAKHSPVMKIIEDGILTGTPFVLPDEAKKQKESA